MYVQAVTMASWATGLMAPVWCLLHVSRGVILEAFEDSVYIVFVASYVDDHMDGLVLQ